MKKVAVIILNYKLKDLTIRCIKSVLSSSYGNYLVVVVDNNSGDGIEKEISNMPKTSFTQSGENLGYAGGNNLGIKKALQQNVDYIFVLNPDTEVEGKTIENLLKAAEENLADIAGPKIYFKEKNKKIIWYAGGIFDRDNVLGSHKGVNEKDQRQYNQNEETDFVTGAAILIKSTVFDKIGLFDERYFLYLEDLDFCLRAKKAGLKVMYLPEAIVWHSNAQSTGLGSKLQDYYITRNRMLLASKFLSLRTRIALFREVFKSIIDSTKRKALIDFLTGSFGKGNI